MKEHFLIGGKLREDAQVLFVCENGVVMCREGIKLSIRESPKFVYIEFLMKERDGREEARQWKA